MIVVVQRAKRARCSVEGKSPAEIGPGLVVFLGVERGDGPGEVEDLVEGVLTARVFENREGKLDRSLLEVGGDLMVIPNFTLCARFDGGGRPGFDGAAPPERARSLFEDFVAEARTPDRPVVAGEFGSSMDVRVDNQGPVTLVMSSGNG